MKSLISLGFLILIFNACLPSCNDNQLAVFRLENSRPNRGGRRCFCGRHFGPELGPDESRPLQTQVLSHRPQQRVGRARRDLEQARRQGREGRLESQEAESGHGQTSQVKTTTADYSSEHIILMSKDC